MNDFICLFTPGRSGTAWITQVFGKCNWEKRKLYVNDNNIVTHESWETHKIPIPEIKQYGLNDNRSIKLQLECIEFYINKAINENSNLNNYFVTAHKIGRFFGYCLPYFKNYKIIYVDRSKDNVISSFVKRFNNREIKQTPKRYQEFIDSVWKKVFYHPSDKSTIIHVSENKWKKYNDIQKLNWYCDETKEQWFKLKQNLDPSRYIETSYEKLLVGDFDRISKFINIPYNPDHIKIKVNT